MPADKAASSPPFAARETLAAIVTPLGEGGIGVVQVSGPHAVEIAAQVFRPKRLRDLRLAESRRLCYGVIRDDQGVIDEAIAAVWRGPDSATGEDLVELNCHGGVVAVRKTLECVAAAGAKKATWADLSARVVASGKQDAIQREAALELPHARTRLAAQVLLDQFNGALAAAVRSLVAALAQGMGGASSERQDGQFEILNFQFSIFNSVVQLLASADFGLALCHPRRLVVAGKPNVGKSTLVNALLGEERVLVHPLPGTTRDAVATEVAISGIPFRLVDTAGVRETAHEIEMLGVQEALRQLGEADVALLVFDGSAALGKEDLELARLLAGRSVIPVLNKRDLPLRANTAGLKALLPSPLSEVSAVTGAGLRELAARVADTLPFRQAHQPGMAVVFTERQKRWVQEAHGQLTRHAPKDAAAALERILTVECH